MKRRRKPLSPLRRIVGPGEFAAVAGHGRAHHRLECGHEVYTSDATTYRARCWRCQKAAEEVADVESRANGPEGP